jgi:ribosomal protein L34
MYGFLHRMSTRDGRNTIKARRRKGRKRLTA